MLPLQNFEKHDLFGGRYRVTLNPYTGLDFSRRCLVFPGQGSAFPGMFKEELKSSEPFRRRFEEADAISAHLKLPPVSSFLSRPESLSAPELAMLRNPALFTAEVAVAELLAADGLRPALLTSHSFGEYAALAVAEVAGFADLFEIVVERDRLSPHAHELGMMIVVNAPAEKIEEALSGQEYHPSNFNGPLQTVISVQPGGETRALAALKAKRLPAKALREVPQPYHTPWMARTAEALAGFVRERRFAFRAPRIPLLSSVTGDLLSAENFAPRGGADFVVSLLTEQLVRPVNFTQQVRGVIRQGVLNFVEAGPGEVCGKFIHDTLGESVFKVTPLQKFLGAAAAPERTERVARVAKEESGLLRTLSKVIASVTGYSVDEISVHDNFQEDLGIDSIRKAEIVFQFMETMRDPSRGDVTDQVNLSQIKRIEDVIEHFSRDEGPAERWAEARPARFERYVEAWEPRELNSLERLNQINQPYRKYHWLSVSDEEAPARLASLEEGSTVVLLATRNEASLELADTAAAFRTRLLPWLAAFRDLAARERRWDCRLALVSEEGSDPYLRALDGFFKCWVREDGFESFKHLRFEALGSRAELRALVEEEFLDQAHVEVRFRRGRREVKRWRPRGAEGSSRLPPKPTLVSIGGAKGIGSAILGEFLSRHEGAHAYVIGRRPAHDAEVEASLARLRDGRHHVRYLQLDVTEPGALAEALRFVAAEHGRIDVLLNGAGQELSRSLARKSDEEFWAEFAGKVMPATAILKASTELSIGRIVNYSSMAAEFGNTGQSLYALANQVMTGLAEGNAAPTTNLVLPPWDRLGMTENDVIRNSLLTRGIALLDPALGARLVVDEIERPGLHAVAFLDANDDRAYDCELTARGAHEGLFSAAISTGRRLTIPRLNLEDFAFLQDHVINGNYIFPGSGALAMFFYTAMHYYKEVPTLENFEVKSFLGVEKNQPTCTMELAKRNAEEERLHLRMASRVVHFQAEARLGNRELRVAPTPFTPAHEVEADPLYDNDLVVLGPSYRLTGGLWFDENFEFAQLSVNSKLPRHTPWITYDRLHQWFEAALQTLGVVILHRSRNFWVPSKIRAVRAHLEHPITDQIYYRVYVEEIGATVARGNVHIVNHYGQVLFELEGVEDMVVGPDRRTIAERFQFSPNPAPETLWAAPPA